MKSWIFSLLLVCALLPAKAEIVSIEEIRSIKQVMYRAIGSSRVTDSLYNKLVDKKSQNALIIAYIGTLEALKAKHSWNPYNKIRFVSRSQKTMKRAVNAVPDNLEIRFMRFTIQHYTPAFLGYSSELDEDRMVIVKHFKNNSLISDHSLVKGIAKFMIQSKRCTAGELKILKKYA